MIKITHISDTHGYEPNLIGGDILIHSGDLTKHGFKSEILKQLNYLHEQLDKYSYIVFTGGNHDFWIERHPNEFKEACLSAGLIPLLNESIEVMGLKIFGSPDTPVFHNWAFNKTESELHDVYKKIPDDTDILITHGPPLGILDKTFLGTNVGSDSLFEKVSRMNLKLHLFGHIHEDSGVVENNHTLFINSGTTICNIEIDNDEIRWSFQK